MLHTSASVEEANIPQNNANKGVLHKPTSSLCCAFVFDARPRGSRFVIQYLLFVPRLTVVGSERRHPFQALHSHSSLELSHALPYQCVHTSIETSVRIATVIGTAVAQASLKMA
jgi:hypothetical protein